MAVYDGLGLCFEVSSGIGGPAVTYSATGECNETHEMVALGRFDEAAPSAVGWLEGVLSAIGEADNQIGGFRVSRLMDPVDIGEDVFPVENVQDWQESGRVAIDGVVYSYTARGPGRLSGITHIYHGDVVRGARKLHYRDAPVLDLGNPYNALQTLRRAFLVESAESEDLNAVGRNLGVFRYPFLPQDETYRRIIQAMAYNPRGTMRGIKLALDAMVGAGNYEITEDLLRHPCTIFIRLLVAILLEARSIGHAYLEWAEDKVMLPGDQIPMDALPVSRGGAKGAYWRDMQLQHSFAGSVRPSDVLTEDYDGDPGTALWAFSGTDESTQVLPGVEYVTLVDAAMAAYDEMHYQCKPRIEFPGFDHAFKTSVMFQIPTGFCQNNDPTQWGMLFNDGWREFFWGVRYFGGQYLLGLHDGATPVGAETVIQPNTWYEVTIEKRLAGRRTMLYSNPAPYAYGRHELALLLDGREVSVASYWAVAVGSATFDGTISFGTITPTTALTNVKVYVKNIAVHSESRQDYGEAMFITGSVGNTGPNRLDGADAGTFRAQDLGKRLSVRYGFASNPNGGSNNGDFLIQSIISDTEVELRGEVQHDAIVLDSTKQLTAETPMFRFPDDLGRKIVISGSVLGNDGTYTIAKLLQMGTGTDLASFDSQVPEATNWCEVVEAVSFVAEGDLDFYLEPNFVYEAVFYYVSDASDVIMVSGNPHLQVRGLLTSVGPTNLSTKLAYSRVLTAQVLGESTPMVELISEALQRYNWYPFFITDPLGFVREYLKDLTAAGVIPEYQIEESL